MFKKITLVSIVFVFFGSYNLAFGAPIISEIMYDLDGADIDWVEIHNEDSADIDIVTLKLLVSNSTSNHEIVKYSGSQVLHGGEYAVIVPTSQISAFVDKWGSSGNIFTSSYTLPNTTAKIEINNGDKDTPMDSVTYASSQGASADGKSLQFISGSWVSATPTPSSANQASGSDDEDDIDDDNDSDSGESTITTSSSSGGGASKTSTAAKKTTTSKTRAEIISSSLAYVGIPIVMQGRAFEIDGLQANHGRYSLKPDRRPLYRPQMSFHLHALEAYAWHDP